jgi:plasmid maintenance system antidote protein VapI
MRTRKRVPTHPGGILKRQYMALRLSKAFTTTPELWLNLQRNYDLWEAEHKSNDWKMVGPLLLLKVPCRPARLSPGS